MQAQFYTHCRLSVPPRLAIVMAMENRLRELRKKSGLKLREVSGLTGYTLDGISKDERGERQLTTTKIATYAKVYGCSPKDIFDDTERMVPIVGYVGAGAEIYPINDYPNGCGIDEVEAPPGHNGEKIVAVCIKGDSMEPVYSEGDILYYSREWDYVPANCIGKKCIVHTADGRTLVKKLLAGTKPGYWQIFSYNGGKIEEVELKWAAPVIYVKYA